MPIDVVGQLEGPEREAAETLKARLEPLLRERDRLTIVVGAKCWGQKHTDLDLVLIARMEQGFRVDQDLVPEDLRSVPLYLSNFVAIVEVKDHSRERVRFSDSAQLDVLYDRHWSDATKQAQDQTHSLKKFLIDKQLKAPFIFSCIWLRNVPSSSLPPLPHNLLGADLDGSALLRSLIHLNHSFLKGRLDTGASYLSLSSSKKDDLEHLERMAGIFKFGLEPTRQDRRKLEIICKRLLKDQQYVDKLGSQLLLFRGRGGAGKTLRLLNVGLALQRDRAFRILFLTYNKALEADVRRLLAILGVPDHPDHPTVAVRSSDKYFFDVLRCWDLSPRKEADGTFPNDYSRNKSELLALLGAVDDEELRNDPLLLNHAEEFGWDFVLVDEGQDWDPIDRDLLLRFFGSDRLIVADGVDQFVRPSRCDWIEKVSAARRQVVPLRQSLRLKSNLCRFVQAFAEEAGLDWDMEVNTEIGGGRVVVVVGPYERSFHQSILDGHRKAGNAPIDALFCVTGSAGSQSATFATTLKNWGYEVWDGTQQTGRASFPTEVAQLRIVKYESSRGLEGWTVVCLDLDRFFSRKVDEGRKEYRDLLTTEEEEAERFATRWCMIPFTRAIDTLVLQVSEGSPMAERLRRLARRHADFAELVMGRDSGGLPLQSRYEPGTG